MKNLKIREKIFLSFFLVTILSLFFTLFWGLYFNSQQIKKQQVSALKNINESIYKSFLYRTESLLEEGYAFKVENVKDVFSDKLFELSAVHNVKINFYHLNGNFLFGTDFQEGRVPSSVISEIQRKGIVFKETKNQETLNYSSYSLLKIDGRDFLLLHTQKRVAEPMFLPKKNLLELYVLIFVFSSVVVFLCSWFISYGLTTRIRRLSREISGMDIHSLGKEISYTQNDEIKPLVNIYNELTNKLERETYELKKQEHQLWTLAAKKMAHDINNPLTPLRLMAQNFLRKYDKNDEKSPQKVKEFVDSVVHQIDVISSITESFVKTSKPSSVYENQIEVIPIIKKTLDIFPEQEVYFYTNTENLSFGIDPFYLTRILTNLVKNALQAERKKQRKNLVAVHLEDKSNSFIIRVEDNGDGIPEEYQSKLFSTNFTTKKTGMGLGLPMVKDMVEQYGGKIWFETKINEGTNFYIEFQK